jgi:hypothetical protein
MFRRSLIHRTTSDKPFSLSNINAGKVNYYEDVAGYSTFTITNANGYTIEINLYKRESANNALLDYVQYLITTNSSTVMLKGIGDETTPIYFGDIGYLDEGHGANLARFTSSTNHGLTESAIGKTFVSSYLNYAVYKIPSTNIIDLVILPYAYGQSAMNAAPWQSGADTINPDSIGTPGPYPISGSFSTSQHYPVVSSVSVVATDGSMELPINTIVDVNYVLYSSSRVVHDPRYLYSLVSTNIGVNITPTNCPPLYTRRETIIVSPNGSISTDCETVHVGSTAYNEGSGNPIQSSVIALNGKNRFLWAIGSSNTTPNNYTPIKWMNEGEGGPGIGEIQYYSTNVVDIGKPCFAFAQFCSPSNTLTASNLGGGYMVMYDPFYEDSSIDKLKNQIKTGWTLPWVGKIYPVFYAGSQPTGKVLKSRGIICGLSPNTDGLLVKAHALTTDGWLLFYAWNEAIGTKQVTLENHLKNKKILKKLTLNADIPATKTGETLTITGTSDVGYVCVRLN